MSENAMDLLIAISQLTLVVVVVFLGIWFGFWIAEKIIGE